VFSSNPLYTFHTFLNDEITSVQPEKICNYHIPFLRIHLKYGWYIMFRKKIYGLLYTYYTPILVEVNNPFCETYVFTSTHFTRINDCASIRYEMKSKKHRFPCNINYEFKLILIKGYTVLNSVVHKPGQSVTNTSVFWLVLMKPKLTEYFSVGFLTRLTDPSFLFLSFFTHPSTT